MRWPDWKRVFDRGSRRHEFEFLPGALEVLETPPSPIGRAVTISIVAFAGITIVWAYLAQMDIVVSASGRIVPKGKVKVIQAADTGVVRRIYVREGQRVKKTDVLMELDGTTTEADRQRLRRELTESQLEIARLNAQLVRDANAFKTPEGAGADLVAMHKRMLDSYMQEYQEKHEVLVNEIRQLQAQRNAARVRVKQLEYKVPVLMARLKKLKALVDDRYISEMDYMYKRLEVLDQQKELEAERYGLEQAESALAGAQRKLDQTKAEFKRETLTALTEASNKRDAIEQELIKADKRKALQQLRAPVDGVVQQLAVTTEGGVVTPAQKLMVVVPTGQGVEVEAQVLNRDIGAVKTGQRVAVKVETYKFTRYGAIDGTLEWVATDSVADQQRGPVYPVRVALNETRMPNVVNGHRGAVIPGMNVTADIVVGKRRVIDYFLGPILRYRDESLRER